MKKTKIIIPALGILLLSTAASVTGTVAWFSANETVKATGMQVKARATNGIVIANSAVSTNSAYNVEAASAKTAVAELYPGSTADLATWLASSSSNPGQANTQQSYSAGTAWTANSGTYGNYVVHDFYIRSSIASEATGENANKVNITSLDVVKVDAIVGTGLPQDALSKSLRVGILMDGSSLAPVMIYAPVNGHDATSSIQPSAGAFASSGRITVTPIEAGTRTADTTITKLPDNDQVGLHVGVYVWFEGEDSNCISNNVVQGLEEIEIQVTFGFVAAA